MMAPPRVTPSKMENVLFVNRKCPQRITGSNKTESQKQTGSQPEIGKPEEVIIILLLNVILLKVQ